MTSVLLKINPKTPASFDRRQRLKANHRRVWVLVSGNGGRGRGRGRGPT